MPSDFKKLLGARFLFVFAVYMQSVVLGWRIYELIPNPLSLGLIGLAEAIPAIGLALYAGYIVDRMRPLLVYRRVIHVSFISGVVVLAEHIFADSMSVYTQAGLLYFAAFLTGLARSFSQPAIFTSVPRMVPRNQLTSAATLSSTTMQIARVAGPAFGGILLGFLGVIITSSTVCGLLLSAIVVMYTIEKDISAPETLHKHASIADELLSGIKFVFNHPILLPALSLDMFSVLFGGVTALLPIFAKDILMIDASKFGLLRAAPAMGAASLSLYLVLNKVRFHRNTGTWLLSAVAGFGLCILIFAMSRNFYLSMALLALSGAFDNISMVIRSSAVQLVSPDHMRGKISAVNSIFIGSSNELGEVESGIAAKILGTVPAVYFGGLACLFTVGLTALLSPALRKMEIEQLEK